MPKVNSNSESSLENFDFNDNDDFFGIKSEKEEASETIKEVKGKTAAKAATDDDDDDFPEDDDEVTDLEAKPKPGAKPKAKVEEEEDEVEDDDFFGIKSKKEETKEDAPEEKEEVEVKKKTKKKGEDEDAKEDEETVTLAKGKKKEDKPEEEDEAKFFNTLAHEMKEKGVFQNVELEKDKEYTEEEFFELQEQELEARVTETLEALFEGMDQDAKDFLQHKKNGGKTHDFIAAYATPLDFSEFDDTNAVQVQQVLRQYAMVHEGLEGEDLEERLTYLKDTGKEKQFATKFFNKMKTDNDKAKEALTKATETAKKNKEIAASTFTKEFTAVADKTEAVGAFGFTKAEVKKYTDYILKPTVKVGKDKFVPALNQKIATILAAKTPEDKKNLLLLAKLLDTNFDVSGIKTKAETEVTIKAKSKLMEAKRNPKASTTGKNGSPRELAEFFN